MLSIQSKGVLDLDFDFDLEPLWHSVGGGACVAAGLTLLRIALEYAARHGDRRIEQQDRQSAYQRDAEARLERVLQDRLADADRRLERCELEVDTERQRRLALEREYALLLRAYEALLLTPPASPEPLPALPPAPPSPSLPERR